MKYTAFDKERGEKKLSLNDFLTSYNEDLPKGFPRATTSFLLEFKNTYPRLFSGEISWSLVQHRKKFMDWCILRVKSSN